MADERYPATANSIKAGVRFCSERFIAAISPRNRACARGKTLPSRVFTVTIPLQTGVMASCEERLTPTLKYVLCFLVDLGHDLRQVIQLLCDSTSQTLNWQKSHLTSS